MQSNRIAIVGGIRTPFVKAGTVFSKYSMQELGVENLKAIVNRLELPTNQIDEFIFSSVLLDPRTPNWAREILMSAGLPKTIYAQSVTNNCISGLIALTSVGERIALGKTQLGIAGGTESMSNPSVLFSKKAASKFSALSYARKTSEKLAAALRLRPSDFFPEMPTVTEPSTGLTMGQHMEISAKEWEIEREEQDKIALASHLNAAKAYDENLLQDEVFSLNGIDKDQIIRSDTSLERLVKLRPVFDRSEKGTLTAGNSSPLTDGSSCVALASEDWCNSNGREALAYIKDYEYAAIDSDDGLLMAPAVAVPRLLKRNNLKLQDFDYVEIHEAFAAQVLANIAAWEKGWKEESIGTLDRTKLNLLGGSIALGHPFAATGGRIVTTLANQLKRNDKKLGLISICAAGAMAGAMILER